MSGGISEVMRHPSARNRLSLFFLCKTANYARKGIPDSLPYADAVRTHDTFVTFIFSPHVNIIFGTFPESLQCSC